MEDNSFWLGLYLRNIATFGLCRLIDVQKSCPGKKK